MVGMRDRRGPFSVGQGLLGKRVRARLPREGSNGRSVCRVLVMAPISDEHWDEILEVHPSLGFLESTVLSGAGETAALTFREYAIERLRRGDQKMAGPTAMGRVLSDIEAQGRGSV